VSRAV